MTPQLDWNWTWGSLSIGMLGRELIKNTNDLLSVIQCGDKITSLSIYVIKNNFKKRDH